jgi:hypothetical protein
MKTKYAGGKKMVQWHQLFVHFQKTNEVISHWWFWSLNRKHVTRNYWAIHRHTQIFLCGNYCIATQTLNTNFKKYYSSLNLYLLLSSYSSLY